VALSICAYVAWALRFIVGYAGSSFDLDMLWFL